MKNTFVRRSAAILAALFSISCSLLAQDLSGNTVAMNHSASGASAADPIRYTSYAELQNLRLVGIYRPDGTFRSVMNKSQQFLPMLDEAQLGNPDQNQVPPSMLLGTNQTVVENCIPPVSARETVKGRSVFAMLRDNIITFAYGHAKVLRTPVHVITDSKGRVIISDPQLASVHVLDASKKSSFRIAGGPMRRLQSPSGLAVDAEDNIYVADRKLGLISVYDPAGRFLRYLGNVNGESMFDSPTGIAIDRQSGRLYVLDATADELIVLDLQGKVLKRVGGKRSQTAVKLRHPLEIAIWNKEVVILDHYGSRIQILDLDCKPTDSFPLRNENGPPVLGEVGLALDHHSRIYVSNLLSSGVRVYSHSGAFLGFLGRSSVGQRFNLPVGLWIDTADRLFIAENNNSRVQVFQIPVPESALPAAKD